MENSSEKLILVVDDDPHMRELLTDKFQDSGFKVIQGRNGEEALELAFKNHPKLIILDILMPKIDGLEALKQLRHDRWGSNVPVIMLTNLNEKSMLAQALEIGIDEYLVKAETKLSLVAERAKAILGLQ